MLNKCDNFYTNVSWLEEYYSLELYLKKDQKPDKVIKSKCKETKFPAFLNDLFGLNGTLRVAFEVVKLLLLCVSFVDFCKD